MAHISEYKVETKFIDRLESIGYEYVDLKNYGEGTHEVEVKVTGTDLKLSYASKTKKVKIIISKK